MRMLTVLLGGVALMSSAASGAEQHRVVKLSTVCLLDGAQYRTQDYVLGAVAEACRRTKSDLVVAPYMPFLSFDAARAAADLAPFAALARAQGTYLAGCGACVDDCAPLWRARRGRTCR